MCVRARAHSWMSRYPLVCSYVLRVPRGEQRLDCEVPEAVRQARTSPAVAVPLLSIICNKMLVAACTYGRTDGCMYCMYSYTCA